MEPMRLLQVDRDFGIDPRGQLFVQPRANRNIREVSPCANAALQMLNCLAAPFCCFCFVHTVKPMHDSVVVRCGIVNKVLAEPGPYCISPLCTDIKEVYMGLDAIEIKNMPANDSHGNPLAVSAQFTYRVSDSVYAAYKTENLKKFLQDQGECALRAVCAHYPFDGDEHHSECLMKHSEIISRRLVDALQALVEMTGVRIDSFRLSNVGFEKSMEKRLLARQEAQAEVIARTAIAEGTAGIVKETLQRLLALGIKLSEKEQNRFAVNLTMLLVNHGHTTLNIFDEAPPSIPMMRLPQAAGNS